MDDDDERFSEFSFGGDQSVGEHAEYLGRLSDDEPVFYFPLQADEDLGRSITPRIQELSTKPRKQGAAEETVAEKEPPGEEPSDEEALRASPFTWLRLGEPMVQSEIPHLQTWKKLQDSESADIPPVVPKRTARSPSKDASESSSVKLSIVKRANLQAFEEGSLAKSGKPVPCTVSIYFLISTGVYEAPCVRRLEAFDAFRQPPERGHFPATIQRSKKLEVSVRIISSQLGADTLRLLLGPKPVYEGFYHVSEEGEPSLIFVLRPLLSRIGEGLVWASPLQRSLERLCCRLEGLAALVAELNYETNKEVLPSQKDEERVREARRVIEQASSIAEDIYAKARALGERSGGDCWASLKPRFEVGLRRLQTRLRKNPSET